MNRSEEEALSVAKVVITGGSGMLGRWVVRHFIEQGYEVLNVDFRRFVQAIR